MKAFPNPNDLVRKIVDRVTNKSEDEFDRLDNLIERIRRDKTLILSNEEIEGVKKMLEYYLNNNPESNLEEVISIARDIYDENGDPDIPADVAELALNLL
jgi:hypothetical protein